MKMLDKYREKADKVLTPFAEKMNIKANLLSYLSLISAFFAGLFAYFSYENNLLLIPTSFLILMNGFFDALDGKIARMKREANERGDFIDHVIDRFSDVFIIGGFIISPWVEKSIGIFAISSVLLVSYLGTQAQAVGYKRIYSGILGRADRIAILFISPLIQFFIKEKIFSFYFMTWVMIYFSLAGIFTIIERYYRVMKWFEEK